MKTAPIFNIQHFSTDDGPGIRTTVFFKGCNLRCVWCHNPESQSTKPDIFYHKNKCISCGKCTEFCPFHMPHSPQCIKCGKCTEVCFSEATERCGKEVTSQYILDEIFQDMDMYTISGGGVTFSGGEPVLQSEFLYDILKVCKEKNIHTAIETAGCYDFNKIQPLLEFTDLVFCDLKSLDEEKHIKYTGASNRLVLENLKKLSCVAKKLIIRIPVIKGFNDDELEQMAEFIKTLPCPAETELLPFHNMCSAKYDSLGRKFEADIFEIPTDEEMKIYKKYFE